MQDIPIPVLGFAAYSGTGKTTLLTRLIPLLKAEDIRIGVIKHAHHQVDVDTPGKDSYELRKAGAGQVLLATAKRWALMVEEPSHGDPELEVMARRLETERLDLILVEGFRHADYPKIELHRSAVGNSLIFPGDDSVIALATDMRIPPETRLPLLDINDPSMIRDFILQWLDAHGR